MKKDISRLIFSIRAFVIMLLLFGFHSAYAQEILTKKSPWKGRDVFRDKECIQCHAVYGQGGKGGPDLGKHKFYGTYLELAALMWNHLPEMIKMMKKGRYKFPELNSEETSMLITYLSFLRYRDEPGKERTGRKLLNNKGCISCHKFGGKGGDIGPDISEHKEYLSPLKLVESLWNHGPDMMDIFEKNDIKRPEFKDNEIVDIAVAIRGYMQPTSKIPIGSYDLGNPKNGGRLVEEKGCMKCHSFRGSGGNQGPDFAEIDFDYSVTQIAGKMWNHGPKMWSIMKRERISIPTFEEGEMADIMGYLYQLRLEDAPGDISEGSKIVLERGCLSCHSLQEEGAGIAFDLATLPAIETPLSMITAMWNHAQKMEEKHLEKKLKWPEFDGRNMANLYAYLRNISSTKAEEK
jgi:cytochrome c2